LAVGVGAGTASATDLALFTEVQTRVSGTIGQTTTVTSGDTYQWTGFFTSTTSQTLTNLGLVSSNSSPIQDTLSQQVNSNSQSFILPVNYYNWPSVYPFNIQISTEVMTVVSGNGSTTLYVQRGANGSTALNTIPSQTVITQVTGTLLAKTNFTGLSLNSGDQVQFFINIQLQ
jgi:hypothetical protein